MGATMSATATHTKNLLKGLSLPPITHGAAAGPGTP